MSAVYIQGRRVELSCATVCALAEVMAGRASHRPELTAEERADARRTQEALREQLASMAAAGDIPDRAMVERLTGGAL